MGKNRTGKSEVWYCHRCNKPVEGSWERHERRAHSYQERTRHRIASVPQRSPKTPRRQ